MNIGEIIDILFNNTNYRSFFFNIDIS